MTPQQLLALLQNMANLQIEVEALQQEVARLRAENEAFRQSEEPVQSSD